MRLSIGAVQFRFTVVLRVLSTAIFTIALAVKSITGHRNFYPGHRFFITQDISNAAVVRVLFVIPLPLTSQCRNCSDYSLHAIAWMSETKPLVAQLKDSVDAAKCHTFSDLSNESFGLTVELDICLRLDNMAACVQILPITFGAIVRLATALLARFSRPSGYRDLTGKGSDLG